MWDPLIDKLGKANIGSRLIIEVQLGWVMLGFTQTGFQPELHIGKTPTKPNPSEIRERIHYLSLTRSIVNPQPVVQFRLTG